MTVVVVVVVVKNRRSTPRHSKSSPGNFTADDARSHAGKDFQQQAVADSNSRGRRRGARCSPVMEVEYWCGFFV
jgi:hypothetical protein